MSSQSPILVYIVSLSQSAKLLLARSVAPGIGPGLQRKAIPLNGLYQVALQLPGCAHSLQTLRHLGVEHLNRLALASPPPNAACQCNTATHSLLISLHVHSRISDTFSTARQTYVSTADIRKNRQTLPPLLLYRAVDN